MIYNTLYFMMPFLTALNNYIFRMRHRRDKNTAPILTKDFSEKRLGNAGLETIATL